MKWRLIINPKGSPYYNMALDEALLEACIITHQPVLRFYDWEDFSVSIGYFQKAKDVERRANLDQRYKIVRRPTGGGAVIHGEDITFSIIFPEKLLSCSVVDSYRKINEYIIKNVAKDENFSLVQTDLFMETKRDDSSLCFKNPTKYDIMWIDQKIGGSAQRRKNEIILHQSSFFFKKCLDLTENDSGIGNINRSMFIETIEKAVSQLFKVSFYLDQPSNMEKMFANDLYQIKYSKAEWNFAR